MDPAALADCLRAASCVVTQVTSGLIIGMLLFLVAAGLTLIFGVLKIVNFTHGSFYMLGAYLAFTVYRASGSFALAVLCAAAGAGLFGLAFERLFMKRVYGSNVLMQLLVCYAFILILDDAVKLIWGPEFKSMGMPGAFQRPPFLLAGGVIPAFEILINTGTVRKLIEENRLDKLPVAIETGTEDGMLTFNQSLFQLVKDGKVSEKEALVKATNPQALEMNFKGIFLDEGRRILS